MKKQSIQQTGLSLFLGLAMAGCGVSTDRSVGTDTSGSQPGNRTSDESLLSKEDQTSLRELRKVMALEPVLSNQEKTALARDWRRMQSIKLSGASAEPTVIEKAYSTLFGGYTSNSLNYFLTRAHYIAASHSDSFDHPDKNTVAANYSVIVWLNGMLEAANPASPAPIDTKVGRTLPNTSTRVGVIQIGDAYLKNINDDKGASIFRIGTLVHESRHSDCPNGMTASQLSALKTDLTADNQNLDIMKHLGSCAFPHPVCPANHELAGIHACDTGEGWGAYSVEVVFFKTIYDRCADCNEFERQAALTNYLDSTTRIIKLGELIAGKLGLPNMSHQGYIP